MKILSDSERRARIGDYIAPKGYYDQTKAMPFLGRVTCSAQSLVAGSWHELLLDYEVGAAGLADGAWIKVTFKFYSDWALFQTSHPGAANYVSAEYQAGPLLPGQEPSTVQSLICRFDQKGHERPFQKAIIVDIVDGYLNPGDHILIRLGDRRFGGPGTRIQTFVEKDFRFRCYADPIGTSRFAAIPGDVVLQIVPGAPQRLVLNGARLIRPGVGIPFTLRADDAWGNTCWNEGGSAEVTATLNGDEIYRAQRHLAAAGWAITRIEDLPAHHEGELAIRATLPGNPAVVPAEAFVTIDKSAPSDRVYYADLHVHSDDTIGTNDTVYNLTYGRDVAGLDILGYTANDFNITAARWSKAVAHINSINEASRFVCYAGTEWSGNSCAGGDHNVVFLHDNEPEFPFDRGGNLVRSFEWNEEMKSAELQPGAWPVEELYATYAHAPEDHLLIPHVGGRRCNLSWHHPALERLVEVGSSWGQFPWLLQDAIRRGYRLGASAAGDEHRGRCGGGVPGTAVFGTRGGLTGVICDTLDRQTVGRALRARHTFATTGEHLIAMAWSGVNRQGDSFDHRGPAIINYRFLGDSGWDEISAYDHSGCFWRRDLQAEGGLSNRRLRLSWGGARIRDRYRTAAWKGTITISNAVIHTVRSYGLEHSEELVWREGANTIGFRTDTHGDTDSIELDLTNLGSAKIHIRGTIDGYVKVGDPLKRNPFVHCPDFEWELTGEELLSARRMEKFLGGIDLLLALDLLTETALPRDVSGTLEVPPNNGPHGFRGIYFAGSQIDYAKAYTSPLFITFTGTTSSDSA